MGRRATVVAASLAAVLAGSSVAHAQYFGRNKVHYDRLEFRQLQTEHFDVYYYDEEEAATRQAARMAERWYWRYSLLLDHAFEARQPLVLYASHPHFAQTNLTSSHIAEGTGGFTEAAKSRIAMPFAAGLGETDHVLGHEIAHAFQIAVARSAGHDAFSLPLWFIEGMAEYLSLGPADAHTAMWMRDAAMHGALPSIDALDGARYSPYRYGHALWSYLCSRFGDDVLGRVLRAKGNAATRIAAVTGVDVEQLTRDWHASIPGTPSIDLLPGRMARVSDADARLHLGPALSPDGERLMFLSERDRLSLDVFLAEAATGRIVRRVLSTAAEPRFESLQYIHSSGAWDPAGRRYALTAVGGGDAVLVVIDTSARDRRQEFRFDAVREIYSPSWSPDGTRIVFSGLQNGLSDLFVFTLADGTLEQLTDDEYADLQPAWSPDGRLIAFATDRFTTRLPDLDFGDLRIGLLDLAAGSMRPLLDDAGGVKQINPQWHPSGEALYLLRDPDGVSNVYRVALGEGGVQPVTDVATGVAGVTGTSPALSVAAQSGAMAMSIYREGRYEVVTLAGADAMAAAAPAPLPAHTTAGHGEDHHAAVPLPIAGVAEVVASGTVGAAVRLAHMLSDPVAGLPSAAGFTTAEYDDRLRLETIAPPYIGAGAGGGFGGLVRGGFGLTFGDLLKDRQLQIAMTAGTRVDDFAAQVTYTNRRRKWNWGVTAGFQPARFHGARAAIDTGDGLVTRETSSLRYTHQWVGLVGRYNIDRTRRIELRTGLRRTGLTWLTTTRVMDEADGHVISRERSEAPGGSPVFLAETQAAFVRDTSVSGPLGPVLGQRLRVEVEPAFGPLMFADVRADLRRYVMPIRPVTFAARIQHVGRYGPDAADPRLTPLVAGLQTLVRGYDLRTFAAERCGRLARSCSVVDELTGSRFAVVNVEVRMPIPGVFAGRLTYPGLVPVEALAFADAGYLWTRSVSGSDRDRFRSIGAGARANLGGVVFEVTAVRAFDRFQRASWTTAFLLRPGW